MKQWTEGWEEFLEETVATEENMELFQKGSEKEGIGRCENN